MAVARGVLEPRLRIIARRRTRCASTPDGAGELCLAHLRATLDALLSGLVVQLAGRPPSRAAVGTHAATTSGRNVPSRGLAGTTRLAGSCPLLVHRPGGDLFSDAGGPAPRPQTLLHVLVLPLTLVTPRLPGHTPPPFLGRRDWQDDTPHSDVA